jgi:prefoldin subunit 5
MDTGSPRRPASLDEIAAEVQRLRERLDGLERRLETLSASPESFRRSRTEDPPAGTVGEEAARARRDALNPFPTRQPTASNATEADAPPPPAYGPSAVADVLTADDETAERQLDHLRASITRLREARAQAEAEFHTLVRPADGGALTGAPAAVRRVDSTADVTAARAQVSRIEPRPAVSQLQSLPAPKHDSAAVSTSKGPNAARPAPEAGAGVLQPPVVRGPSKPSPSIPARPKASRGRVSKVAVALAAFTLVIAAYLYIAKPNTGQPPAASSSATRPAALPELAESAKGGGDPAAQGSNAVSAAPRNTADQRRARVELRTTREVWLRATTDGRTAFERLVPAGQTLQLDATRTVVLRVGDGGGVRVLIDGADQGALGRDGEVVTRTFELPAPRVP